MEVRAASAGYGHVHGHSQLHFLLLTRSPSEVRRTADAIRLEPHRPQGKGWWVAVTSLCGWKYGPLSSHTPPFQLQEQVTLSFAAERCSQLRAKVEVLFFEVQVRRLHRPATMEVETWRIWMKSHPSTFRQLPVAEAGLEGASCRPALLTSCRSAPRPPASQAS